MNKKTARWYKTAFRLNAAVGVTWIGVGLRDFFAPHLFRFDGQVAAPSTFMLDFALGAIFLLVAWSFRQAMPRTSFSKS